MKRGVINRKLGYSEGKKGDKEVGWEVGWREAEKGVKERGKEMKERKKKGAKGGYVEGNR